MLKIFKKENSSTYAGADPGGGGGAHPARAPPKIGKNMIFWRKIVIFHTKYPKSFRASLRSGQFENLDPPLICVHEINGVCQSNDQ